MQRQYTTRQQRPRRQPAMARQILACLAVLLCAPLLFAAEAHDLQDIRHSSEDFLRSELGINDGPGSDIEVTAGRLDPRLRLEKCSEKLSHYLPQGHRMQGQVAVGVRCETARTRWSIFVPVTITQFADIVVTREAVPAGTLLRADQLKLERRSLNRLYSGYIKTVPAAVGQRLKSSLPAAAVVTPRHLKRQYLVKRGQTVNILAKNAVVAVRSKGKALANARAGEQIRVKNLVTNKIVTGTVAYNGFVEIKL